MLIKSFDKSLLGANMYLLCCEDSYFIVDPCCEPDVIKDYTRENDIDYSSLKAIFITHGHFDHICTVDSWKSEFPDVPVYIDDADNDCLENPSLNGSFVFGYSLSCVTVATPLSSINHEYKISDDVIIRAINTPGHSKGSVCYIVDKYMFTGDMLFQGSIGRTDLPGGDTYEMKKSIELLKGISEDYVVLPGHGPSSSLSMEKKFNPYF